MRGRARGLPALGEVAGDVLAQALTLVDGLAVIGGGISGAHPLFLQPLVDAANGVYERNGDPLRRLIPRAFNLEDPPTATRFSRAKCASSRCPERGASIACDPLPRTAVGISRLGTSQAVAIGAYAFALSQLGAIRQ